MEAPRNVQEIITGLSTIPSEKIGGAVFALPNSEQTSLREAVFPTRDELQTHIESLTDDPDLGSA